MDELGAEARALVRAARAALRPTAAERECVLAALGARVSLVHPVPAPPMASGIGVGGQAISALCIGLTLAGVAYFGWRSEPGATVVAAPPGSVAAARATVAAPPAVEPVPAAAPERTNSGLPNGSSDAPAASARRSDRLAEEVLILSRAEAALHAGHFARALALLDQHARVFPQGKLSHERIAARARALCGLGRVSEANAELSHLPRGSLQEARAREACNERESR